MPSPLKSANINGSMKTLPSLGFMFCVLAFLNAGEPSRSIQSNPERLIWFGLANVSGVISIDCHCISMSPRSIPRLFKVVLDRWSEIQKIERAPPSDIGMKCRWRHSLCSSFQPSIFQLLSAWLNCSLVHVGPP